MESVRPPLCSRRTEYLTLRVRHLEAGTSWVLELSGEADTATLDLLQGELEHLEARSPASVVVDVTLLQLCDIASARMILGTRQTMQSSLRGESGPVKAVFDLLDVLREQEPPQAMPPVLQENEARAA